VLQSGKKTAGILDAMDIRPLKNTKTTTETHEMDGSEALEDGTLESHSRD
jgi:hypothetical protein